MVGAELARVGLQTLFAGGEFGGGEVAVEVDFFSGLVSASTLSMQE